eukprot:PhM_4_TR8744/c0_g1_i1/m.55705
MSKALSVDVCVIGGGIAGAALTSALRRLDATKHLKVVMLDRAPLAAPSSPIPEKGTELRTVSLTSASEKIIRNASGVEIGELGHRYNFMTVRDPELNAFSLKAQGTIAGNGAVLGSIMQQINDTSSSSAADDVVPTLFDNVEVSDVALPKSHPERALVSYKSALASKDEAAKTIEARLVVGCDGALSSVRKTMQCETLRLEYQHHACVATLAIDRSAGYPNTTCFQNFLDDGSIVAFLPTTADTANVVFSTSLARATSLKKLSAVDAVEALNAALHNVAPRDIPKFTKMAVGNGIVSFPLALNVVRQPYSHRAVLVGDAARAVHPMAGQGLNMGLYDVAVLVDEIRRACDVGEDIGDVGEAYYNRWVLHTHPMLAGMEVARNMFSASNFWVRKARRLGMGVVDSVAPVQDVLTYFASGTHVSGVLVE